MVYARTRQAASALSQAVQAGNLQKEYLALIHGCPTQPAGTWEDLLWKDSAKNKVFVVRRMRKGGQSGQARLPGAGGGHSSDPGAHPLVYRPEPPDPGAICQPGASLAGDHKYGSRDDIRSPALWSFRLTLPHPVTGETITCLHPPEGELWHTFPMISREIPRW